MWVAVTLDMIWADQVGILRYLGVDFANVVIVHVSRKTSSLQSEADQLRPSTLTAHADCTVTGGPLLCLGPSRQSSTPLQCVTMLI
jgi:hypothetical protein